MIKFFYIIVMILMCGSAYAQNEKTVLNNIEKYINNLTTARGDFKQLTSGGGYATGKFYLSRPGKIRLDYESPNNIQLLADGNDFIYYDKNLVQVTYLSMDSSIAGVLVKDNFSFSNPEFKVENLSFVEDTIRVVIASVKDPLAGKIILIFKNKPLQLIKWQVIDAQGIATTVLLENMEFGVKLSKDLFIFNDPRHNTKHFKNN